MAKQKKQKKQIKKYNKTKAVFYFIEQKILEILLVASIFGLIWLFHELIKLKLFLTIICIIFLAIVFGGLIFFIYLICKENWDWAKRRASK